MKKDFTTQQKAEYDMVNHISYEIMKFIYTESREAKKDLKGSIESFQGLYGDFFKHQIPDWMTPSQAIRGAWMALNDSREDVRDLRLDEQAEIKRIILEKYGVDLDLLTQKDRKKVKEIIKRGSIDSADEYRLLETHLSMLSQNEGCPDIASLSNEAREIMELMQTVRRPFSDD